jgi:hypothetical protein
MGTSPVGRHRAAAAAAILCHHGDAETRLSARRAQSKLMTMIV